MLNPVVKTGPLVLGESGAFFKPVIQRKLIINQPNDFYEQQADEIANKVMHMPATKSKPFFSQPGPIPVTMLQKKCAHCEEDEKLQMKSNIGVDVNDEMTAPSSVHTVINNNGIPLDSGTRDFMESRLDYDFSKVQIHNDSSAHRSSDDINALAYTHGNHIVFGSGQYQPNLNSGKHLLAHELVHVIQQSETNHSKGDLIHRRSKSKDRRLRKRAATLKAADAAMLINGSLPFVFAQLSPDQLQQIQRVLDAYVVNPVVQEESADLERRSTKVVGNLRFKDEKIVSQIDQIWEDFTPISERDKFILLNHKKLLTADAFHPITENPDEAVFLSKMKKMMDAEKVWLRFTPKFVNTVADPGHWFYDPRNFEVWLSLGIHDDVIPTPTGRIDRKSLLDTMAIGAGYYREVDNGPLQTTLRKEISKLEGQIEAGLEQHDALTKIRDDAAFGVVGITDFVGGASFPGRSIWYEPRRLLLEAMSLRISDKISGAQAYLVAAAMLTRNAAQKLSDYISDSSSGVTSTVSILGIAVTAGKVAEVGLAIAGVAGAARKAIGAGMAEKSSVDQAAEELLEDYLRKNPGLADDLAQQIRYVPQPKGSIGGGVKPGSSSGGGVGWHSWK